jgi:DNA invertase Pin-like site-specific DNA recombinase
MTRAAIYARYSSDLQSPASIEDQLRKCREYAAAHEIPVDDQCIFADAAISGEAMPNRPRLQALLDAAERKPCPFDVLLIDDSSRLSRDDADGPMIRKRLRFAGIRLIAISQNIDSNDEQSAELWAIHSMVDSLFIRELGKKTHRGLEGKMLKGFSAGGRTFGYDNVQTPDGVRQQVNLEQAATVRRIFELAAEGRSLKGIAKTLNAESIAPPRPRANRRPAWCHNAIRAMLRNPTYTGKVIWNRDRFIKTPAGKRVARPRPESEWRRLDAPELRIIDDDLWERVQRTLAWKREHYSRGGGMYGRVNNHLLTGFLRCAECSGPLTIVAGYHKAARRATAVPITPTGASRFVGTISAKARSKSSNGCYRSYRTRFLARKPSSLPSRSSGGNFRPSFPASRRSWTPTGNGRLYWKPNWAAFGQWSHQAASSNPCGHRSPSVMPSFVRSRIGRYRRGRDRSKLSLRRSGSSLPRACAICPAC